MGGRFKDSYLREMKEYCDALALGREPPGRALECGAEFVSELVAEVLELREVAKRPDGIAMEERCAARDRFLKAAERVHSEWLPWWRSL